MLIAGAIQLVVGAKEVGVTTDEPAQALRTQGWLDDGWFLPPLSMAGLFPKSPYIYGPAFSATAHALNGLLGNESRGSISFSKDAWTVRHLVAALLAVAAALAAYLTVWSTTGSRKFGLWAAAALLAVPIWTGMGFFNPKDIPAAAGYTMFTAGLVLALAGSADSRTSVTRGVGIGALVGLGVFFAAGTRLALWLPLTASLVTYAAIVVARRRFTAAKPDRVRFRSIALGLAAGVGAMVAIYPSVFEQPVDFLTKTLSGSADFPWTGATLTAGRLVSEDPPWWYLPTWAFASMPVLISVLGLFGAGVTVWSIFRRSTGGAGALARALSAPRDLALLLVIQQAVLVSFGSVVLGSNMYSGLRQHLYVVPAMAILAGIGGWRLWEYLNRRGLAASWHRGALAGLLCAALVIPMAEQTLLFPYNYTYINPIAGIGGINGRWETDYWWASGRNALQRVPAGEQVRCSSQLDADGAPGGAFGSLGCLFSLQFAPYVDEQGQEADQTPAKPDGNWTIGRSRAGAQPPAFCRSQDNVTRWLRGESVLMSWVLLCDRSGSGSSAAGE
ncbi:MAG: hypothetical protein KDB62_07640 [Solirubrobacterales bacterium]|nr:hypothetical protein [Solirubrobacterales bacterium]